MQFLSSDGRSPVQCLTLDREIAFLPQLERSTKCSEDE